MNGDSNGSRRGRRAALASLVAILLAPMSLWALDHTAQLARQFQAQLNRIEANAARPGPHPPVILTAAGANAYLARDANLPKAIRQLRLSSAAGIIRGQAEIDFSQLPRSASGGFAGLVFTGVHHVAVTAHLDSGAAPAARITIQQVSLDGTVIPNFLIELAIREFVTPKYPQIQGRTFPVALPRHVRALTLGAGRAILSY